MKGDDFAGLLLTLFIATSLLFGFVNTFVDDTNNSRWKIDYDSSEQVYSVVLDVGVERDITLFRSADIDSCETFAEMLVQEKR